MTVDQEALFAAHTITPDPAPGEHPDWLRAALKDSKPAHTRRTWWETCGRCHTVILRGDDGPEPLTLTVTADPTPLDTHAEMTAILTRRAIFTATPAGPHRYKLTRIHPHPSHRHPGVLLLPAHVCHQPLAPPTLTAPDPPAPHPDDPVPF